MGILCLAVSGEAKEDECRVPGTPAQWMAAYCMEQAKTDDVESPAAQKCLKAAIKDEKVEKYKMPICEQKIYWKKMICALFGGDAEQQHKCSQDKDFVPVIVQQGN